MIYFSLSKSVWGGGGDMHLTFQKGLGDVTVSYEERSAELKFKNETFFSCLQNTEHLLRFQVQKNTFAVKKKKNVYSAWTYLREYVSFWNKFRLFS